MGLGVRSAFSSVVRVVKGAVTAGPMTYATALALAVGAAGGAVFAMAGLPLPWMLGSMTAALLAAVMRAPVASPLALRDVMRAAIGVALGVSLTPGTFDQIGAWAITLPSILLFCIVCGLTGRVYFARVAGVDPTTAYFAALPGGLVDMAFHADDRGGDMRFVALAHGARIFLVVMALPFLITWFAGPADTPGAAPSSPSSVELPLSAWAWFLGTAAVGWSVAAVARLPAAPLLGPMIASGGVHLAGLSDFAVAREVVILAQIVIGTVIGCRFVGVALPTVARTLALSSGHTILLLVIALAFAAVLSATAGIAFVPVLLAFSPAGLAEMSLIAVALQIEVAFVVAHHMARVLVVVLGATPAYALLTRFHSGPS